MCIFPVYPAINDIICNWSLNSFEVVYNLLQLLLSIVPSAFSYVSINNNASSLFIEFNISFGMYFS